MWIRVDGQVQGTGVLISEEGHILTAAHVVRDGQAKLIEVVLNSGRRDARRLHARCTEWVGVTGRPRPAEMGRDWAVIRVEAGQPLPYLPVADSDGVRVGERVLVAGFPWQAEAGSSAVGPPVHVARGRITAIMRSAAEGVQVFNTDAAIREGMSGGPCVDERGNVIGLALMYSEKAGANLILPSERFRQVRKMGQTPFRHVPSALQEAITVRKWCLSYFPAERYAHG